MKVTVEVYGPLRNVLGWRSTILEVEDGSTLLTLLELITAGKPDVKEMIMEGSNLKDYVKVLVNGRDCRSLSGLKTKLEEGCVISVFPPAGGG
ncbi:MAG: MoaD family protein [Candidatus Nezhaarchaeota archaeon]|nr:MoaD family protein [Candidatus Nezhaarchaeota archaeon]